MMAAGGAAITAQAKVTSSGGAAIERKRFEGGTVWRSGMGPRLGARDSARHGGW